MLATSVTLISLADGYYKGYWQGNRVRIPFHNGSAVSFFTKESFITSPPQAFPVLVLIENNKGSILEFRANEETRHKPFCYDEESLLIHTKK